MDAPGFNCRVVGGVPASLVGYEELATTVNAKRPQHESKAPAQGLAPEGRARVPVWQRVANTIPNIVSEP